MIELVYNKGFHWFTNETIYIKGYFFTSNNEFFENENALNYFSKIDNFIQFKASLIEINGSFAVVVKKGNEIWLAVDQSRSIPLFYSIKNEYCVSDSIESINRINSTRQIDEMSVLFFKYLGFCEGNSTLIEDVSQLMAGQCLNIIIDSNQLVLETYFSHLHSYSNKAETIKLLAEFDFCLKNVFKRLIQSLNGKTVVIPLSGGLDSRLIATMLKLLNYPNVICYSYGSLTSFEVAISKKVALNLGFEWHFVPYDLSVFDAYFDSTANEFRAFAGNFSTFPQEQEYFAVESLCRQGLIPENALFIPGYCADLPAGSYLPNYDLISNSKTANFKVLEFIENRHVFRSFNGIENELIATKFKQIFKSKEFKSNDDFVSFHENWFTTNKVSKNIVNTIRTYEHFGYEWRLPFWDKEFLNFFYALPNEKRIDKNFYKFYLSEKLFNQYEINFEYKTVKDELSKSYVIQFLKNILPSILLKKIKKVIKNDDINNSEILFDLINKKVFDNNFDCETKNLNFILANWYLKELE